MTTTEMPDLDAALNGIAGKAAPDIDQSVAERLMPAPTKPMPVARKLIAADLHDGHKKITYWRGGWYFWMGSHWAEVEEVEVTAMLQRRLEYALYKHPQTAQGVTTFVNKDWDPDNTKISHVRGALRSCTLVPAAMESPSWPEGSGFAPAGQIVAFRNCLLDVTLREYVGEDGQVVYHRQWQNHTPRFFNEIALPFNYDPAAPEPVAWKAFLEQIFNGDQDAIKALQAWFGYVISGRLDQQKILMLSGPPRSGKGTLVRVLQDLIGEGNCAGPSLSSLKGEFGLQPLLGKSLAVVSDARLDARTETAEITERLLKISGEDAITVGRKNRTGWYGKLPTRFMILSNFMPRLDDPSGAIAGRYIVIKTQVSFLGREDHKLGNKLLPELPGILNWALEGLDALNKLGHLQTPKSSAGAVRDLGDLTSPVSEFVRECTVDDGEVETRELFKAWEAWAKDNGHHAGSSATFGQKLRAVKPDLPDSIQYRGEGGKRHRKYVGISLDKAAVPDPPGRTGAEYSPGTNGGVPVTNGPFVPVTPPGATWPYGSQAGGQN